MKYRNIFLALQFLLPAAGVAAANYASVGLTHIEPIKTEATWLRDKQFMPRYPIEMAMEGVAGCGIFKVSVDKEGTTSSITLVSSVPEKSIAGPATGVIKEWNWTLANGKSPAGEEKLIRLDFCMGGSSQEESVSKCQQQASMLCE